jgi:hypothetical protein
LLARRAPRSARRADRKEQFLSKLISFSFGAYSAA